MPIPMPVPLVECKVMIEQLRYAVEYYRGKTVITQSDINLLDHMYDALQRADLAARFATLRNDFK